MAGNKPVVCRLVDEEILTDLNSRLELQSKGYISDLLGAKKRYKQVLRAQHLSDTDKLHQLTQIIRDITKAAILRQIDLEQSGSGRKSSTTTGEASAVGTAPRLAPTPLTPIEASTPIRPTSRLPLTPLAAPSFATSALVEEEEEDLLESRQLSPPSRAVQFYTTDESSNTTLTPRRRASDSAVAAASGEDSSRSSLFQSPRETGTITPEPQEMDLDTTETTSPNTASSAQFSSFSAPPVPAAAGTSTARETATVKKKTEERFAGISSFNSDTSKTIRRPLPRAAKDKAIGKILSTKSRWQ